MLTTLISINLMMTLTFIFLSHPLSMGLIILIQTITISLITGNMNKNFWFSYILFLIMVGGMLILFMYMTSIASNEKFKINTKIILIVLTTPIIFNLTSPSNSITNNETCTFNMNPLFQESLNKFINQPLMMTLIFMMIYLFLVLIATVKITDFKSGTIRQMN